MNKKIFLPSIIILFVFGTTGTVSCSSANDDEDIKINIPTDDEDCCSLEEEELTINYLKEMTEVFEFTGIDSGLYDIKIYSPKGSFHVGYNEIYFTVEKNATGRHVKDVEFKNITPLMNMKGMKHSTPVGNIEKVTGWIPVFRTWISFLMPTDIANTHLWSLSFDYRIKEYRGFVNDESISVAASENDNVLINSFKWGEDTYYLSLVNPSSFSVGVNNIQAYLSKKAKDHDLETPYPTVKEDITIELTPIMPDMGNHTSPNNEAMHITGKGIYEGKLNLTMTGRWNIHLTIRDINQNIIAGKDYESEEYGNFYWSIQL